MKRKSKIYLLVAGVTVMLGVFSIRAAVAQSCYDACHDNPDYDCILHYSDGTTLRCPNTYVNDDYTGPVTFE